MGEAGGGATDMTSTAGGDGVGGDGGDGDGDGDGDGVSTTEPIDVVSTFPAVTDFAAPGPFDTMQETSPGCTVHRPTTLGGDGVRHPIIVWGNGTYANPGVYAAVLSHWASHGFVVGAANTTNAGSGTEMITCLDWIIAQDSQAGSPYEGNVDAQHVGASGHSQGGGGTLMAGRDQRMTLTAPLEPYIGRLGGYQRSSIGEQSGPMFLMSGANDSIASPSANQQPIFDGTNVPVFWGTLAGADHLGSATGDINGFRGPATAWFRLHLMQDESARSLFYGADCGLCSDSMWEVQKSDID